MAIGAYAEALWTAFTDLSFDIVSVTQNDSGLVPAEWLMKGNNTGSFNGLPPTGVAVALPGADFVRVEGDKIRSVQGYFDAGALPRALGLDVIVQPRSIGPFGFGTSVRASTGSTATPGAFSITWLEARSAEDRQKVREIGRKIATEMLAMPGFISWVSATVGDRMMTITAWETPDAVAPLMKGGEHRSAVGSSAPSWPAAPLPVCGFRPALTLAGFAALCVRRWPTPTRRKASVDAALRSQSYRLIGSDHRGTFLLISVAALAGAPVSTITLPELPAPSAILAYASLVPGGE